MGIDMFEPSALHAKNIVFPGVIFVKYDLERENTHDNEKFNSVITIRKVTNYVKFVNNILLRLLGTGLNRAQSSGDLRHNY